MPAFRVRTATKSDRPRILEVVEEAFDGTEEVDLVRTVWQSPGHDAGLDLVAEVAGDVVGHALFSLGRLEDGTVAPALAPLAVAPGAQNEGVGSALVMEGIERAELAGWPLIIVTGHWDYYPRLGFEPATPLGLHPVAPEGLRDLRAFMVKRLSAFDGHRGVYRYCWETTP